MNKGKVTIDKKENIATLEFYHPSSNSLPRHILSEIATSIEQLGEDDSIQIIILKSAGERVFCAGASFDELSSINDLEAGKKFFLGFANVINAARKCSKIIIGRIQGKAVGGGVGMASATDYCFATKYASIKLSELAIGIGPFVVGPAVERKIGLSAMSELAIDATSWKNAQWALEKGLYNQVFETTNEMDKAISKLATRLSKSNPLAMQKLKKIFWQNCDHWDTLLEERATISGELVLSNYTKSAIKSFKLKS